MKNTRYFIVAAMAALGAFIIALPYYILPVDFSLMEGKMGMMMHHPCFFTARGSLLIGGLVVIGAVGFSTKKFSMPTKAMSLWLVPLGIATVTLPRYILPICMSKDMNCHQGSVVGWTASGILLIFLGLAASQVREAE